MADVTARRPTYAQRPFARSFAPFRPQQQGIREVAAATPPPGEASTRALFTGGVPAWKLTYINRGLTQEEPKPPSTIYGLMPQGTAFVPLTSPSRGRFPGFVSTEEKPRGMASLGKPFAPTSLRPGAPAFRFLGMVPVEERPVGAASVAFRPATPRSASAASRAQFLGQFEEPPRGETSQVLPLAPPRSVAITAESRGLYPGFFAPAEPLPAGVQLNPPPWRPIWNVNIRGISVTHFPPPDRPVATYRIFIINE
jgi:hypothetical protein